jgi:hypothetical protein
MCTGIHAANAWRLLYTMQLLVHAVYLGKHINFDHVLTCISYTLAICRLVAKTQVNIAQNYSPQPAIAGEKNQSNITGNLKNF